MNVNIEDWTIEEETGYKPQTSFYRDFSIAERFGDAAIEDTYNKCMAEWKTNIVYLTELALALNWKMWRWYKEDLTRARLYCGLYQKTDDYAMTTLSPADLAYFCNTLN